VRSHDEANTGRRRAVRDRIERHQRPTHLRGSEVDERQRADDGDE